MLRITSQTTLAQLAAIVSQLLERAGIAATLSGGARKSAGRQERRSAIFWAGGPNLTLTPAPAGA
jgi:hypothetical protein